MEIANSELKNGDIDALFRNASQHPSVEQKGDNLKN
jgi:hypothetical protein